MVAAPLILVLLFTVVVLLWFVMSLDNDPAEEIRAAKRHRFFGPGGPDDPFADDPYDD